MGFELVRKHLIRSQKRRLPSIYTRRHRIIELFVLRRAALYNNRIKQRVEDLKFRLVLSGRRNFMVGLKQHPVAVIDYLKRLIHTPRHLFSLLMAEQVFGKLNPTDEGTSSISGHFTESVLVSQFRFIPVRSIRQITVLPAFLIGDEARCVDILHRRIIGIVAAFQFNPVNRVIRIILVREQSPRNGREVLQPHSQAMCRIFRINVETGADT